MGDFIRRVTRPGQRMSRGAGAEARRCPRRARPSRGTGGRSSSRAPSQLSAPVATILTMSPAPLRAIETPLLPSVVRTLTFGTFRFATVGPKFTPSFTPSASLGLVGGQDGRVVNPLILPTQHSFEGGQGHADPVADLIRRLAAVQQPDGVFEDRMDPAAIPVHREAATPLGPATEGKPLAPPAPLVARPTQAAPLVGALTSAITAQDDSALVPHSLRGTHHVHRPIQGVTLGGGRRPGAPPPSSNGAGRATSRCRAPLHQLR